MWGKIMGLQSYLRGTSLALALLGSVGRPVAGQTSVPKMIGKDLENAGRDVLAIWTSPFDANPRDILVGLFYIGSAAAISPIDDDVDRWAVRHQNSSLFDAVEPFRKGGALYTGGRFLPVIGALYVTGLITKKQSLRDAVIGCGVSWGANSPMRAAVYRLIGRERPDPTRGTSPPPAAEAGDQYNFDVPNNGDWGWNSFPGGHLANIVGCTSFLGHRFHMGVAEPLLYAFAGAVAVARTADRAHWTSDQWLGTVLGFAIGREIAHRQLKREAARAAAVANGSVGALTQPSHGLYVAKSKGALKLGWQRTF